MRAHVASAAVAAGITALAVIGAQLQIGAVAPEGRIAGLLANLALPGFYVAHALGFRNGPDGLPGLLESFVLAFVVWWVLLEVVWWGWSRVRATPRHSS